MKNKKLWVSLIAVVFSFVVICLSITAFTIKQVKISFVMSSNSFDAKEVTASTQVFNGKNLLFFNTSEIKEKLEENPYIKVVNVEKVFPNVINVEVEERREIYFIDFGGKTYITDKDGFVLSEKNEDRIYGSHEYIKLNLLSKTASDNFAVVSVNLGEKIQTTSDEFFYKAISLCEQVNLTDSVKELTVEKYFDGQEHINVTFNTYSNVKIVLEKAEQKGAEKTEKAFKIYDEEFSDYRKSEGVIRAIEKNDGIIEVQWNKN